MSVVCLVMGMDGHLASFLTRNEGMKGGINVTCDFRIDVYLFR